MVCDSLVPCRGEYGDAFYLSLVHEGEGRWKTVSQKFSVRQCDQDEGQEII